MAKGGLIPTDKHNHGIKRLTDQQVKAEAKGRYGKITPQVLEEIVEEKVRTIANYLTPDVLKEKLDEASLKEIAIYEGTMMDKLMLLRGQPTMILGHAEQVKLDDAAVKLLEEIRRRGVKMSLTERKADITVPPIP